MSRWTAPELAALRVADHDYELFVRLVGDRHSYDAWEVKRRRQAPPPPPTLRSRLVAWLVGRLS